MPNVSGGLPQQRGDTVTRWADRVAFNEAWPATNPIEGGSVEPLFNSLIPLVFHHRQRNQ